MKSLWYLPAIAVATGILLSGKSFGQDIKLPDYAPLLPATMEQAWPVDPAKGYLVREIKPNIFLMTNGGYQVLFVTTGKGVVLFDAPAPIAQHINQAVAEVTHEPLVMLVYSHIHVDHIGGAGLVLQQNPKMKIIAEEGTAAFLREQNDPTRPVPTSTFKGNRELALGSMSVDLKVGHWHSPEGDLFVYFPTQKVLMAIDTLSSGDVPFMDFDLSRNTDAYLKVFDQVLAYDFDILVPGHHSNPSTRDDVKLVKQYAFDIYDTVKRIHESDHKALLGAAIQKYGKDNTYPVARVLIDDEVNQCAREIQQRWSPKLNNVDVWGESECRSALVYYEWDVGSHSYQ